MIHPKAQTVINDAFMTFLNCIPLHLLKSTHLNKYHKKFILKMDHPKSLRWVSDSNGNYPKFSVQAGVDSGNYLYVARANHQGAVIPGKLAATHKTAYIPYNMKEVPVSNYEVLVAPPAALSWVEGRGGNIPANAVLGGNDNGERLYIGRVIHNNTITVGKVHPSHGVCYYPYGGEEKNNSVYEILVVNAYGQLLKINPN